MKKKVVMAFSVVLALCVIATSGMVFTSASSTRAGIEIENVTAKTGKTVDVKINLINNPGLATLDMEVLYDMDIFTLKSVKDGGLIVPNTQSGNDLYPAHSDNYISPYHLSWPNDLEEKNITATGTLVTLTFEVADNANVGDYNIVIDPASVIITDYKSNDVECDITNGTVTVADGNSYLVGDVNGDGEVNKADSMILSRYIGGWKDYDKKIVNMDSADLNRDGEVNKADSMILSRYVGGWKGYDKYIITVT